MAKRGPNKPGPVFTESSERVISLVAEGHSIRQAAPLAGVPTCTVYFWLWAAGTDRDDPIVQEYRRFRDRLREAEATGAAHAKVRETADGRKFRTIAGRNAPVYRCDESLFDPPVTEKAAWLLGWMATDGNVWDDNITVSLQPRDIAVPETMQAAFATDAPIRTYRRKETICCGHRVKAGEVAQLRFHSAKITADLAKCGVTPNKTWTVKPWLAPADLMRHYWRGCFEGDGGFSRVTVGRWAGRWCADYTGNFDMVTGFAAFISAATGSTASVRREGSETPLYKISFTGVRLSKMIAHLLYHDAHFWLPRKKEMAEAVLVTVVKHHSRRQSLSGASPEMLALVADPAPLCSTPDCGAPRSKKGLCHNCYARQWQQRRRAERKLRGLPARRTPAESRAKDAPDA